MSDLDGAIMIIVHILFYSYTTTSCILHNVYDKPFSISEAV